jgi:hypothetical protein
LVRSSTLFLSSPFPISLPLTVFYTGGWFDEYIQNEYYNNGMVRDFGVSQKIEIRKFRKFQNLKISKFSENRM